MELICEFAVLDDSEGFNFQPHSCIRANAIICCCSLSFVLFAVRMEKKQCGECQLEINEIEPLRCGFCEVYFHISMQCCGFNLSRASKDLFSQGKAVFVCSNCRDKMNGRSVKQYFTDELTHDTTPSPDGLPAQVQQLFNLVESLSDKVDKCISMDIPAERPSNRSRKGNAWPRLGVKRRRGNEGGPIGTSSVRGTNAIDLSDLSVPCLTPPISPPKFWLYLSGLHPLITAEDIQKITSRCLDLTTPADVVRLVPKEVDMTKLTFISFKVGLDPSLKELALDASTWPDGILFREFTDYSKNQSGSNGNPLTNT